MDNGPKYSNAVPLEDLSILSSSTIFVDIWEQAGMGVLRELNGEVDDEAQLPPVESIDVVTGDNTTDPPEQVTGEDELDVYVATWKRNEDYADDAVVDSRDKEDTEDQQTDKDIGSSPATLNGGAWKGDPPKAASLDLGVVITRVIPAALRCWQDFVDRMSCGKIEAQEAWGLFSDSDTHQKEQVRQVFEWASWKRPGIHAGSPTARAAHFSAALKAFASVKWFLDTVPKLLDTHVVLYSTWEKTKDRLPMGANIANPRATASTGNESQGEGRVAISESSSSAIFAKPVDEDPSRAALEEILKTLQMRWTHLSIDDAPATWNDVEHWGPPATSGMKRRLRWSDEENHGVLGGGRLHVELLCALSAVPDLVDWLVKVCIL